MGSFFYLFLQNVFILPICILYRFLFYISLFGPEVNFLGNKNENVDFLDPCLGPLIKYIFSPSVSVSDPYHFVRSWFITGYGFSATQIKGKSNFF